MTNIRVDINHVCDLPYDEHGWNEYRWTPFNPLDQAFAEKLVNRGELHRPIEIIECHKCKRLWQGVRKK